jgi:hypothetical protein
MNRKENLTKQITEGCGSKAVSAFLGRAILDDEAIQGAPIKIALKHLTDMD